MSDSPERLRLKKLRKEFEEYERQAWKGFWIGAVLAAVLFLLSIPLLVRM